MSIGDATAEGITGRGGTFGVDDGLVGMSIGDATAEGITGKYGAGRGHYGSEQLSVLAAAGELGMCGT